MKEYEIEYIVKARKTIQIEGDEDFDDVILEDFEDDVIEFKIIDSELIHDFDEEEREMKYLNDEYERNLL